VELGLREKARARAAGGAAMLSWRQSNPRKEEMQRVHDFIHQLNLLYHIVYSVVRLRRALRCG